MAGIAQRFRSMWMTSSSSDTCSQTSANWGRGMAMDTRDEERSPKELAHVAARVRQAIAIIAVDPRPHAAGSERDRDTQFALEATRKDWPTTPPTPSSLRCRRWPRKHKWWPAFAELVALIEPQCECRRLL